MVAMPIGEELERTKQRVYTYDIGVVDSCLENAQQATNKFYGVIQGINQSFLYCRTALVYIYVNAAGVNDTFQPSPDYFLNSVSHFPQWLKDAPFYQELLDMFEAIKELDDYDSNRDYDRAKDLVNKFNKDFQNRLIELIREALEETKKHLNK